MAAAFFFVLDALTYVYMVQCGRSAAFMWLCKLHTIEGHVLHHVTVESTNLLNQSRGILASARTKVVLYWRICSTYTPSTVFKICLLSPTTHREGLLRVGSLPLASTCNRGVVQHTV